MSFVLGASAIDCSLFALSDPPSNEHEVKSKDAERAPTTIAFVLIVNLPRSFADIVLQFKWKEFPLIS
jgi:hypothetical protein